MAIQTPVAKEPEPAKPVLERSEGAGRPWPPEQGDWTYEDWLRLPDNGWRYEVIKGVLYVTPAPKPRHQAISRELEDRMWTFVKAHNLGQVFYAPIDVFLPGQETPVQPDIIFIARDRLDIVRPDEGIYGAPDLIVEVLSPSDWIKDREEKLALYAETGVREYWIVAPKPYGAKYYDQSLGKAPSIDVYTLREAGYELQGRWGMGEVARSEVLPGFSVVVDEIFNLT